MKNNKAVGFMILIIVVCVIISVSLLLKYFYFGRGGSKYGNRLEGIEAVEIKDERKSELAEKLKENKNVSDAKVTVTGKIIYIRMVFEAKSSLVDAQSLAVKTLEEFSEDEKNFYDISFTLVCEESDDDEGFRIMGSKNVNGSNLVWNNNNPVTKDEE